MGDNDDFSWSIENGQDQGAPRRRRKKRKDAPAEGAQQDERVFVWHKNPTEKRSIQGFFGPAQAYLIFETIIIFAWFVGMGMFKSTDVLGVTDKYRTSLYFFLFHFAAPLQMVEVVQNTINDASTSWFTFLAFAISIVSDVSGILDLALLILDQEVYWAWLYLLILSCAGFLATFYALVLYTYWFVVQRPGDVPTDVSRRRRKTRARL